MQPLSPEQKTTQAPQGHTGRYTIETVSPEWKTTQAPPGYTTETVGPITNSPVVVAVTEPV